MAVRVTVEEIAAYRTAVLEGGDGVGKSTLAHILVTRHGFASVHSPRTPDHQDLVSRYRDLLARPGKLVLDRSFLSELVYGPLYRGHSRITWTQALDLAELVTNRDGIFLHLIAPAATVHERLNNRDGQAPEAEELSALAEAYERTFRSLSDHVPVLTYDTASNEARTTG